MLYPLLGGVSAVGWCVRWWVLCPLVGGVSAGGWCIRWWVVYPLVGGVSAGGCRVGWWVVCLYVSVCVCVCCCCVRWWVLCVCLCVLPLCPLTSRPRCVSVPSQPVADEARRGVLHGRLHTHVVACSATRRTCSVGGGRQVAAARRLSWHYLPAVQ